MANSADPRKQSDKLYTDRQSQAWKQPLKASTEKRVDAWSARLDASERWVVDQYGARIPVGEESPQAAWERNRKERDRSDSYYERHRSDGTPWPPGWSTSKAESLTQNLLRIAAEKKAKKPQGDRSDSSEYRQDDFSMQDADCWQQGQWVFAHSDGVLLKWKRKDAPAEVLQRLQA
ncbi:hypothetical protein DOP62_14205 (plasmid) [Synechococcus elongatus PCC 11801]|uniref:Uncharacterized protein n=1 Tax=Synechococcus elongatus PCC 11801 TaxID=2219813 RepID=A0ACD5A671_SYNEL